MNLLSYINHFNTGLKQKLSLGHRSSKNGCCLKEIQTLIKHCCYDIMVLPSILSYTELQSFVTELQLLMLVSLELDFIQLLIDMWLVFHNTCPQRQAKLNITSLMGLILKWKQYTSTKRILIGVVGMGLPSQRSHMDLFLFQGWNECMKCSKTNRIQCSTRDGSVFDN